MMRTEREQNRNRQINYYDAHKSFIIEKRRQISMQKKEEKLINLFLGKINQLNINKMVVIQKVINYLHV